MVKRHSLTLPLDIEGITARLDGFLLPEGLG